MGDSRAMRRDCPCRVIILERALRLSVWRGMCKFFFLFSFEWFEWVGLNGVDWFGSCGEGGGES